MKGSRKYEVSNIYRKSGFYIDQENNCFYIDKTDFIREWWENQDSVTLITRPRDLGKTLEI
ncbi:MAG: AAA family ATPase [Lachnospiraceae bacterium]